MSSRVLDASALLALIFGEAGSDIVAESLEGSMISSVNVAEVFSKLDELGLMSEELTDGFLGLGIVVVDFDLEQVLAVARLRSKTKAIGLSLGDRACIALGISHGVPVVTADRAWGQLTVCKVELIR